MNDPFRIKLRKWQRFVNLNLPERPFFAVLAILLENSLLFVFFVFVQGLLQGLDSMLTIITGSEHKYVMRSLITCNAGWATICSRNNGHVTTLHWQMRWNEKATKRFIGTMVDCGSAHQSQTKVNSVFQQWT